MTIHNYKALISIHLNLHHKTYLAIISLIAPLHELFKFQQKFAVHAKLDQNHVLQRHHTAQILSLINTQKWIKFKIWATLLCHVASHGRCDAGLCGKNFYRKALICIEWLFIKIKLKREQFSKAIVLKADFLSIFYRVVGCKIMVVANVKQYFFQFNVQRFRLFVSID